ncbi:hypothetical protein M011DRAFT_460864 [Sporormia fimetaria CBS 119925]|uniref:Uncharacterized protein n=1 Tax=Sporormia fimetaria CBS 119925 TaxID=1340428 RepID=A0A6A6V209_9PLEO|nr:hypothetical protein M011DRAFT_460864 [Sporormia fimetaria CBS 119925]
MTGRGELRYHTPTTQQRSSNPQVTVGLSIELSPSRYDPSSTLPLYLVVSAELRKSPRPDSPITLATLLNPLDFISDRSFGNIDCVYPANLELKSKHIKIWPYSHFRLLAVKDMRETTKFVTVRPGETLQVKHEVPRDAILAAGLGKGERYRVEMTDIGLGTRWWRYGTLEEVEGKGLKPWAVGSDDDEDCEDDDDDEEGDEAVQEKAEKRAVEWVLSEDPQEFAFVIEKSDAEVEII